MSNPSHTGRRALLLVLTMMMMLLLLLLLLQLLFTLVLPQHLKPLNALGLLVLTILFETNVCGLVGIVEATLNGHPAGTRCAASSHSRCRLCVVVLLGL